MNKHKPILASNPDSEQAANDLKEDISSTITALKTVYTNEDISDVLYDEMLDATVAMGMGLLKYVGKRNPGRKGLESMLVPVKKEYVSRSELIERRGMAKERAKLTPVIRELKLDNKVLATDIKTLTTENKTLQEELTKAYEKIKAWESQQSKNS